MSFKNTLRSLIQRRIVFTLFLTGLLALSTDNAKASHAAGMDIFYRWTSGRTYEFTVIFYRNCNGGIAPSATMPLGAKSASLSVNVTTAVNLPQMPTGGSGVPPLQPSNIYNCTYATLCYEEYVYRGSLNLNNLSATPEAQDWIFFTQVSARPTGPFGAANIQSAGGGSGYQYVECGLNNKDFPDATAQNWSPLFHNRRPNHPGHLTDTVINFLMRTVCEGNYYSFDLSAREYQGDSLSYDFYIPQDFNGADMAYIPPYCFNCVTPGPMPAIPPISIDPVTGIIPLVPGTPTGTGVYVIGVEVTEWRNDTIVSGGAFAVVPKKIGYVRRDMTIWIDPNTTCRRDSAHPKDVNISNGGGDTVVTVFFHTGVTGDPNTLVRCNSISPDGSEFRLIDSSNYVQGFDTTVRNIGINRAVWDCNQGGGLLTNRVELHLAEKLKCQKYYIMLKKGSDLDVLESECGFLEPEFSYGTLNVSKNVKVKFDTVPPAPNPKDKITICLPKTDPFPYLTASSQDSSSFPLSWYWSINNDTVEGQNVPYIWATQPGDYRVLVRDPLNCTGSSKFTVFFDSIPDFRFDLDPYCHRYGEPFDLPDFIAAPQEPGINKWEWFTSLGLMGVGDTLRTPQLLKNMEYRLVGTKSPIAPGALSCSYEYTFTYDSANFPPENNLWVKFVEDELALCLDDDDTGQLVIDEGGISQKYAPLSIQWYKYNVPMPGKNYSRIVKDTGLYQVHVEDTLGCWGRDTARITHDSRLPGPYIPCEVNGATGTFAFEWEEPYASRIEMTVVSTDGGNTWYRSTGDFYHTVNNIQQQRSILARGIVNSACEYTEVSLSEQCPDEVFPPNVITPNGDGVNDYFEIRGLELFYNNKCELEIFDRWGNRVYQSGDYHNNWNGGDSPEGTYYYILRVKDGRDTVHRGIITILR